MDKHQESLFDIGMAYDVLFSPLCVSSEEWQGDLFQTLPIYQESCRDGAVVA
jgi:hypothetical protein